MKNKNLFSDNKDFFTLFFLVTLLSFQSPAALLALDPPGGMTAVQEAKDIQDRSYLEQVHELMAAAQKTLDIAVDKVYVGELPGDPVDPLLKKMILASKRGVKVRLFLNTFSEQGAEGSVFLRDDQLWTLRHEGVEVHFVNPEYRLYDRLVIADSTWVLEGGLPWIREPLEKGLASASLVQSETLARKKITRLEFLPLWDVETKQMERSAGRIPVPVFLLRELDYFPSMVKHEDGDAMKIYLALLRIFYQVKDVRFLVEPKDLTAEIPADRYFENGTVTFQIFKTLDRLAEEYRLIKIENKESDRMSVRLVMPDEPDPVIGVPQSFFQENYAKDLSPEAIYAYLVILKFSQSSGESPVWLGSEHNVEQDFPVAGEEFRAGVKELRKVNLVEVFPFKLTSGPETLQALENRYLLNSPTTLSERLSLWSRLRDQFGDDAFKQARDLAALLGEPEDPKVVAAYLDFLRHYPADDILGFTQHLAALAPLSTPALLDYLNELLIHESRTSLELAAP